MRDKSVPRCHSALVQILDGREKRAILRASCAQASSDQKKRSGAGNGRELVGVESSLPRDLLIRNTPQLQTSFRSYLITGAQPHVQSLHQQKRGSLEKKWAKIVGSCCPFFGSEITDDS